MSDHTRLKINRLFGGCQIVGPYFFEGNVNRNLYLAMLNELFQILEINWELGIMVVLRGDGGFKTVSSTSCRCGKTATKATLSK